MTEFLVQRAADKAQGNGQRLEDGDYRQEPRQAAREVAPISILRRQAAADETTGRIYWNFCVPQGFATRSSSKTVTRILPSWRKSLGKRGYGVTRRVDEEHALNELIVAGGGDADAVVGKVKINHEFIDSPEYRALFTLYQELEDFHEPPFIGVHQRRGRKRAAQQGRATQLFDEGGTKRASSLQRYKGLGEMNPEQLWETTMDPETRRLLQVTIEDLAEADQVFTTLMGDKVEPRRAFIEKPRPRSRKPRYLTPRDTWTTSKTKPPFRSRKR